MELSFKIVFYTSLLLLALVVVAVFLLLLKLALLFFPEITIYGITFSQDIKPLVYVQNLNSF